jgi:probable HAF family extracellular repeat protein
MTNIAGASRCAATMVLALALAVALTGLANQPAAAETTVAEPAYTVTELDPSWTSSIARDINESGRIAGQGQNPGGQQRAFLWADGQTTDLQVPSGGNLSRARGINDRGQVVGEWRIRVGDTQKFKAFLYENGQIKDLNTLIRSETPWDLLGAQSINERGQIVGSGVVNPGTEGRQTQAFLYQDGAMTNLGESLGDPYSAAWGINDSGSVVGTSGPSEGQSEAFVLRNGSVERLGIPFDGILHDGVTYDFSASEAVGINKDGVAIGWSYKHNQTPPVGRAFFYDGGETIPLDPLKGDPFSRARDIDESGRVVGWSRGLNGNEAEQFSAVLWESGQAKNLNDLIPADSGWDLVDAYAINESGQIVGSGFRDGNTSRLRAFLLTDTTEPSINIETSPSGDEYKLGEDVTVSYDCTDGGSGVTSCSGPMASGDKLDTTSVGQHTFTVQASDRAGNVISRSYVYRVVYDFGGFFSPVDNLPTLNTVNAGRAVPVKFSLSGDQGLDILAAGYPASQRISCDSTAPVDTIEETVAAGASGLTYDPGTGEYTYVWKTKKAWEGTCRQFIMELDYGKEYRANFRFR